MALHVNTLEYETGQLVDRIGNYHRFRIYMFDSERPRDELLQFAIPDGISAEDLAKGLRQLADKLDAL